MLSVTCQMSAADIGAGVSVMDDATGFIAAYLPVIRESLFVFAGIIAIVGVILVSYQMQTAPEKTRPLILALCGSCAFVTISAVTLPMFFGYDEQGVFAYAGGGASGGSGSSTGGSGSGGSSSGTGGSEGFSTRDDLGGAIIPKIPDDDNSSWMTKDEYEDYIIDHPLISWGTVKPNPGWTVKPKVPIL